MSLLAALGGALLLWWNPVDVASLLGVVILGFAIAPIFPALVSGTSDRVGPRYAANTIGMQIGVAGLSAALLPGFAGFLARRTSLEIIPVYVLSRSSCSSGCTPCRFAAGPHRPSRNPAAGGRLCGHGAWPCTCHPSRRRALTLDQVDLRFIAAGANGGKMSVAGRKGAETGR